MPSAETEKFLTDAGNVNNVSSKHGKLIAPATRYLRYNERERRKTEMKRIKNMLDPMNVRDAAMGPVSISQARHHLNALQEDLETNSPPENLSGETKDALFKEQRRLEDQIAVGMLTQEEMRRNGVTATDRHIKWEKANKAKILTWKNIKILLNPDSEDQDLCNIEQIRRAGFRADGAATFDPNAQIPGVFAMTPQAKANWPENMPEFGTVNSPLKQAEELERLERENAELKAKLAKTDEAKKERRAAIAANRKAQSEKMKARWAAKKAGLIHPPPEGE